MTAEFWEGFRGEIQDAVKRVGEHARNISSLAEQMTDKAQTCVAADQIAEKVRSGCDVTYRLLEAGDDCSVAEDELKKIVQQLDEAES